MRWSGWPALMGRKVRPVSRIAQRGDDLLEALLHDDGDELIGEARARPATRGPGVRASVSSPKLRV